MLVASPRIIPRIAYLWNLSTAVDCGKPVPRPLFPVSICGKAVWERVELR